MTQENSHNGINPSPTVKYLSDNPSDMEPTAMLRLTVGVAINRQSIPHSVLDIINRTRKEDKVECLFCGLDMDKRGLCGVCGVGSA